MNITLIYASLISNIIAVLMSFINLKRSDKWTGIIAKISLIVSFLILTWLIILAWTEFQRPPFKTLFESLILLSWCIGGVSIFTLFSNRNGFLWILTGIVSAGALWYALGNRDLETVMLPPALQSVWFVPHVVVYFTGYGALVIGTLRILAEKQLQKIFFKFYAKDINSGNPAITPGGKIVRIGFAFLSCGLVMGAIWADEAWGAYWGWDPKENWALITFLTYGAYLHLPNSKRGSTFEKTLLWAGIFTILFTYLGMHLLPVADESVHIYQ